MTHYDTLKHDNRGSVPLGVRFLTQTDTEKHTFRDTHNSRTSWRISTRSDPRKRDRRHGPCLDLRHSGKQAQTLSSGLICF